MRLPSPRSLFLPALAALAVAVAGCGGDSGGAAAGGEADPASVMPKSAIFYAEAVVRPEGDQQEAVTALLGKVLRADDPGQKLEDLIDQGLAKQGHGQTFAKDIEPWLGGRIGVTATNLAADEPGYIVAAATKDAGKASAFVVSESKREHWTKDAYKGTDYYTDTDNTVVGVVDDFVVVTATEADFKSAVDAGEGEGLADVERFSDAVGDLPDERLGTLYVDPQAFGDAAAAAAGDPAAANVIQGALKGVGAFTAFALAASDAATIESRVKVTGDGAGAKLFGAGAGAGAPAELMKSLPDDAWAAFGVAKVGESVRGALNAVAGGLGSAVLGGQLEQQTGINLEQDLLSWVGDMAVFVRGGSLADIGGGLVIEATDEAKAAAALPKLVSAARAAGGLDFQHLQQGNADQAWAATVPGAPGPVVLARSGSRVVLTIGDGTADEALKPSGTLGDSGVYNRAKDALDGLDPSFIVDAPAAVKLIGEAAGSDPDYAQAKPYLDMLDLLAAGSTKDGDTLRQRFTAKVK